MYDIIEDSNKPKKADFAFDVAGGTMNEPNEKQMLLECVRRVREGDQEAFSQLLEQYRPLIQSQLLSFSGEGQNGADLEDLRQEALMAFYHAILAYDLEQREVEFGLYAKICISNALISHRRIQKRREAEQLTETLNIESFLKEAEVCEDPVARVLEQEREQVLYAVIRKNLSDFEYRVWQLYMSGRTAAEIGRVVGKDEKSVSNAIYRIRKKLRALLS